MHKKIPKICTGCRVSAAKIYLYHSTKIAKARPHSEEWETDSSVQKHDFEDIVKRAEAEIDNQYQWPPTDFKASYCTGVQRENRTWYFSRVWNKPWFLKNMVQIKLQNLDHCQTTAWLQPYICLTMQLWKIEWITYLSTRCFSLLQMHNAK